MGEAEPQPRRWRPQVSRPRLGSIQGKLLLLLLLTSIVSTVTVGYFGYRSGSNALRAATYDRVHEVSDERLKAVQAILNERQGAVQLDSQGMAVIASVAFNEAYADLDDAKVDAAQRTELDAFYSDVFLPRLQENSEGQLDYEAFVPTLPARTYLQANYTVKSGDFEESIKIDDVGDGSEWSKANARFHPYFRSVAESLDLDDVLLLDKDGNVVYTAYKGAELGSNVTRGEYADGNLEKVFTEALKSNSRDYVAIADFEFYQPAYGEPVMFIASPVGTASNLTGVLVYEVSVESLNGALSGDVRRGMFEGLGESGKTYLVGGDGLMRTDERTLLTDPDTFKDRAIDAGVDSAAVDRMVRTDSSVLLMPDRTRQRGLAERGRSGVIESTGVLGDPVLVSYQPAHIDGLEWSMISQIQTKEALAPVGDFTRNLLLATAALILLVSALSVLAARVFTKPVSQLLSGVRSVAAGQLGTRVKVETSDEFADLADGFNDMSSSLLARQVVIDEQQARNLELLRSLMPDQVAESVSRGEAATSNSTGEGSVVYVNVEGVDAASLGLSPDESLALIGSITGTLEAAAKEVGVDRVRMVGSDFLGSCGLVSERADHIRRVVDFALGAAQAVQRISSTTGADLTVRVGIDSGTVGAGVAASGDRGYKLWGEAVSLAFRLPAVGGEPGIYVTDAVRDHLDGSYDFTETGTVLTQAGETHVWKVAGAR